MKKRVYYVLILLMLQLTACARRGDVVYEAMQESFSVEEETEQEETENDSTQETEAQNPETVKQQSAEASVQLQYIYVDISGAVHRPGVYELPSDSRMFQAVEAAGGFTELAEVRCVNQADSLSDGEKIYIYTREEAEELGGWMQLTGLAAPAPAGGGTGSAGGASTGSTDGKVNLNRADKAELMTLAGVGEARADAIIAWRETQGAFSAIEDIMKVSGIKEKLFEQIRDKITV